MAHVDPTAAEEWQPPRMNTDDIAEAADAAAKATTAAAVEGQYAGDDDDDDDAYDYNDAAYQSPSRVEEFALVHTADVSLTTAWVSSAFERVAASESGRATVPKDVTVGTPFPVPTTLEFCMAAIGTQSFRHGEARPVQDVEAALELLDGILQSCLRLSVFGEDGPSSEADEVAQLFADDEREAVWDVADPDAGLRPLADLAGCVDLLARVGIQRRGTRLVFRYSPAASRSSDEPAAPSPRLVLALKLVRDERRHIQRSGELRLCAPVLAGYAERVAAFDAAEKRFADPLTFPTYADLLEWIDLRNWFYKAAMASGGEVPDPTSSGAAALDGLDDDGADDGDMGDTWMAYFSSARTRCQDVLERVESYHSVFRMRGLSSTPATLLGDTLALRVQLHAARESASSRPSSTDASPARTPLRKARLAEPDSPSDFLTRTPKHPTERALFLAARPPLTDLYRDPETEHAGLLNIRQCCFVNAFVQFAFAVPELVSAIFAFPAADALRSFRAAAGLPPATGALFAHNRVVYRLQALLAFLRLSSVRAVNPIPLLDAVAAANPLFSDGAQHDPHEFASAVFDSLTESFDEATKADPTVADLASLVEWTRFVRLATKTHCVPRRVVMDEKEAFDEAPDDAHAETHTTFVPVYLHAAPAKEQQERLRRRAASLALPGRPVASENSSAPTTPAAVPVAAADDATASLAVALDDFFNEVIDANVTNPNADREATAAKLRWLVGSDGAGEPPATLFLHLPTRVNSANGKRFDAVEIPAEIDLKRYRASATAAQRRLRVLRNKAVCTVAESELTELSKAKRAAAEAAQHAENTGASVATAAFQDALESAERETRARHQAASDRLARDTAAASRSDDLQYDLVAIIVHLGLDGNEGHYVTYARTAGEGGGGAYGPWHLFDDAAVTELPDFNLRDEALRRNAYCFCYRKSAIGRCAELSVPPPSRLQELIEREDLRSQARAAELLSAAV